MNFNTSRYKYHFPNQKINRILGDKIQEGYLQIAKGFKNSSEFSGSFTHFLFFYKSKKKNKNIWVTESERHCNNPMGEGLDYINAEFSFQEFINFLQEQQIRCMRKENIWKFIDSF